MEIQLAMKNPDSSSWTIMVRKLLIKYELQNTYEMLGNTHAKSQWKRCVEEAVLNHWEEIKEDARSKSSLR